MCYRLVCCGVDIGGFFFSSRRRHTRLSGDWSSDVVLFRSNKTDLVRKIRRIALYRDQITLTKLDAAEFLSTCVKSLPKKSLINIDPPYYGRGPELYCSFYKHEDHVALARTISKLERPWILTYDDTKQVRKIYNRRKVMELSLLYSAQVKRVGVELLYMSRHLSTPMEEVAQRAYKIT